MSTSHSPNSISRSTGSSSGGLTPSSAPATTPSPPRSSPLRPRSTSTARSRCSNRAAAWISRCRSSSSSGAADCGRERGRRVYSTADGDLRKPAPVTVRRAWPVAAERRHRLRLPRDERPPRQDCGRSRHPARDLPRSPATSSAAAARRACEVRRRRDPGRPPPKIVAHLEAQVHGEARGRWSASGKRALVGSRSEPSLHGVSGGRRRAGRRRTRLPRAPRPAEQLADVGRPRVGGRA